MSTDSGDLFDNFVGLRAAKIRIRQITNTLTNFEPDLDEVEAELDEVPDLTVIFDNKLI